MNYEKEQKKFPDLFWEDGSVDIKACKIIKNWADIYGEQSAFIKYGKDKVNFAIKEASLKCIE